MKRGHRTRSTMALVLLMLAAAIEVKGLPPHIPPKRLRIGQVSPHAFDRARLDAIDAAIEEAIAAGKLPGGVFHLERDGITYTHVYGRRAILPAPEPMTESTIFDAASITKVTATTPSIWILIERGKIGLDDHVSKFLPEFRGGLRDDVTIRHLLTHTSGLRPDLDLDKPWHGYATGIALALAEIPRQRPGYVFRYSDINFILLGEIVHRVSGLTLDEFAQREVFSPLRMKDTRFNRCRPADADGAPCTPDPPIPPAALARTAPTEMTAAGMLRGIVHDPTSRRMGGVAGHAGMFTTTADLSRYARMLLSGGELDGVRILKPQTVKMLTSVLSPAGVAVRRSGGLDIDSSFSRPRGDIFPVGSYGHTGFTGGFFWIDPASHTFYVFFSNRVHPNGHGSVTALQRKLGTLSAAAAGLQTSSPDPCRRRAEESIVPPRCPHLDWVTGGADAMNGVDVLEAGGYRELAGLRVGLITNHSGIDRAGNPTIDLLRSAPGVQLVALFSPEHGIRGNADEKVGDTIDSVSGLPIYSLYGERRKPSPEQLAGLDALVFDVQDIGARFYTYAATMAMALEACAGTKTRFVVLDRVDPIGGEAVEGPVTQGDPSFIAYQPISVRHGMTLAELALLYKREHALQVDVDVVRIRGWRREMWQDEAGLPWIDTSPAMRSLRAAALYPGLGLLESAISVGRGTETPFEVAGAPYIDGVALAQALGNLHLQGVAFTPTRFTPSSSLFAHEECGGVAITVTDRHAFEPVRLGVAIATTLRRMYGERFDVSKIAPLLREPAVLGAITAARPFDEIVALWQAQEAAFRGRRAAVLLY